MNAARPNGVDFEATDVARAKLQFWRIATVRHGLMAVLESPDAKFVKRLRGLERYEHAAFAKQQQRGLRFQRGKPQLTKRSQSEQQGGGKQ